jgi:outer membrane protein assembly factor BamA
VDYGLYGYDRLRRYYYDPEEEAIPDRRENVLGGLASFVRDTSQWEIPYHPTAGTRLDYTVRQTVPSNPRSLYYTEQILDVRRYIRISRRVSLAFRAVGGGDLGRDPQDFYLGGGDTLRGYSYTQLYGSRFALGNFEFRFPILDYLVWPIEGFAIGGFRSLFFVDLGSAWSKDYNNGSIYPEDRQWYTDKEDQKYTRFTFASTEGGWHLVHPKMAFGTGVRWWFGYFDLKLDWAWRTNLHGVDNDPYLHFTLGSDF